MLDKSELTLVSAGMEDNMLNLKSLEEEKFFKFYKFLFEDERFEKISIEGKVLYSLMIERYKLSVQKELPDNSDYYIILGITEIQKILRCGSQKAVKVLNELELVSLIDKKAKSKARFNIFKKF